MSRSLSEELDPLGEAAATYCLGMVLLISTLSFVVWPAETLPPNHWDLNCVHGSELL